ncbi:hypothetical protein [Enterovirga sp. CN4-39]|uniref:hypothetical protein n=1 Tax=Enterovirga sp. CN4-39 TaxID=3400910 RepID=UPI003C1084C7
MNEPKPQTRGEFQPKTNAAPALPPDRRRRAAVRTRPDRRSRIAPTILEPDVEDEILHASPTSYAVDPDFDDFGQDLDAVLGLVPDAFADDEGNWFGL